MRTIERTTQFKRDFKRESKSRHGKALLASDGEFATLLHALLNDRTLSDKYRDHGLGGDWHDFRDCHIRPDLILIYRKIGLDTLQLVRLGSHSELGL